MDSHQFPSAWPSIDKGIPNCRGSAQRSCLVESPASSPNILLIDPLISPLFSVEAFRLALHTIGKALSWRVFLPPACPSVCGKDNDRNPYRPLFHPISSEQTKLLSSFESPPKVSLPTVRAVSCLNQDNIAPRELFLIFVNSLSCIYLRVQSGVDRN